MYVPLAQHPEKAPDLQLVVRTSMKPAAMAETLRLELKHEYPDMAVRSSTMTENIAETQRLEHLQWMLFGSFAGISLFVRSDGDLRRYGLLGGVATVRVRLAAGGRRNPRATAFAGAA